MPLTTFIKNSENWLRLAMFILGPLREALLNILHNSKFGIPHEPKALFTELSKQTPNLLKLKSSGKLKHDQWNLLFPPGQQETDSNLFDITLIVLLIKTCTKLTPENGWKRYEPEVTDHSLPADVIRVLGMRNTLQHYSSTDKMDKIEFEQKWLEGTNILQRLPYAGQDVLLLKTVTLDSKHDLVYRSLVIYLKFQHEELCDKVNENTKTLTALNCLPTDMQKLQEDMEASTKSLALLESAVQKGSSEINDKINEISAMKERVNLLETFKNDFEHRLRKLEQGTLFYNRPFFIYIYSDCLFILFFFFQEIFATAPSIRVFVSSILYSRFFG